MWAKFPPNQWPQLKYGRVLAFGAGLNRAPIGWKKHIAVVITPRIA